MKKNPKIQVKGNEIHVLTPNEPTQLSLWRKRKYRLQIFSYQKIEKCGTFYKVMQSNLWGILDEKLNEVLPISFLDISVYEKGFICTSYCGQHFYNLEGTDVFRRVFFKIDYFDFCLVCSDVNYSDIGLAFSDGKYIVFVKHGGSTMDVSAFYNEYAIILIKQEEGFALYSLKENKYLTAFFKYVDTKFYNGSVRLYNDLGSIISEKGETFFIKKSGKIIKGCSCARYLGDFIILEKNGKKGWFDYSWNELIPCKYTLLIKEKVPSPENYLDMEEYEDRIIVRNKKKMGVFDCDGHELVPTLYDKVEEWAGYFWTHIKDKQGRISEKGELFLSCKYDRINSVADELFICRIAGKEGLYGKGDVEIIPPIYDKIEKSCRSYSPTYFQVKLGKKYGIMDTYGTFVIPLLYDKIRLCDMGFVVETDGLCGAYNIFGKKILPVSFAEIEFLNSILIVKNKYCGLRDIEGKVLLKAEFDDLEMCSAFDFVTDYYIEATKNGCKGAYSVDGKMLIPLRYDCIIAKEGKLLGCDVYPR